MIIHYAKARLRSLSPAYTAYRDRVVAAGGSIYSAATTQQALDVLAILPSLVQWLDARHGVGQDWYSICPQADALRTAYGNPLLYNDTHLGGQRALAGGAWNAGHIPQLELGDAYTWGMRYYQNGPASGTLWGNRYGNPDGWNQLQTYPVSGQSFWESYPNANFRQVPLALPVDSWEWLWCVKQGPTVTLYDGQNQSLGTLELTYPIVALDVGIAGGTDSAGVMASKSFFYQTFVRAASALSAAQRAAIQAA